MIATFMALKRAKAVMTSPRISSLSKVWGVSTSISLVADRVVVAFEQEGEPVAFLLSEPGIMPWLIVRVPDKYGSQRTILATSSVQEATAAVLTLLETAKK